MSGSANETERVAQRVLKILGDDLPSPRHAVAALALVHASIIASHRAKPERVTEMIDSYVNSLRTMVDVSKTPGLDS